MNKGRVLIIDDEDNLRRLLSRIIGIEGYDVMGSPDGKTALKLIERNLAEVIVCDVKLGDTNGLELMEKIKTLSPASEVIMLTAFGNIPDGVSAIKHGAFDYITKGDDNEKILPLLSKAMEKAQLQFRMKDLEKRLEEKFGFKNILGKSPAILEAVALARQVAPTDTTVLLLGETGTGKEVFARAIHAESPRSLKSFIAVNCSAISHEILESELFGHKAGAFTGASRDKKGLFDEAHRGTLFLDEIGEMPVDLQAKLLRVLENGTFLKVGETKETMVDVRIIAATNRDLNLDVAGHRFREDLLYRLSVFQIRLPSLSERIDDIPLLTELFVKECCMKSKKKLLKVTKAFEKALFTLPFKGNIRELRNIIERAVILCEEDALTPDLLPSTSSSSISFMPAEYSLAAAEKARIEQVLHLSKGNKTRAAKVLGIGLTTLYQKIKDYRL